MLNDIKLLRQLNVANTLGEGVIWDHRLQLLYWTDIHNKLLYRANLAGEVSQIACPEKLCSFGLCLDPQWLICAFASGFAFFNPLSQHTQWIARSPTDNPNIRMNDGRVDRQGRFWAGSMVEAPVTEPLNGSLYRLDLNGQMSEQLKGIEIANSLCWSPESDKVYFADSPKRQILVADFTAQSGKIGPWQVFTDTPIGAYPDGACIDSEGCLWSAQWGSASVKRYSPTGKLLLSLDLPCQQPSCVAFAGNDLNYLCVTSARQGLSQQSLTQDDGALFIFATPYTGLPESVCQMAVPSVLNNN